MSLRVDLEVYGIVSFPRVSGDEPSASLRAAVIAMFSPRERG